jgi:hypothetical protein
MLVRGRLTSPNDLMIVFQVSNFYDVFNRVFDFSTLLESRLPTHSPTHPPIHPSIYPSIHPSIYPPIITSVNQLIDLYIHPLHPSMLTEPYYMPGSVLSRRH